VAFLLDLSTFWGPGDLESTAIQSLAGALVFPSLVVVYLAYWIGSSLFGPRYFYEGLYSLTVFSAAGNRLAGGLAASTGDAWPNYAGWQRLRRCW